VSVASPPRSGTEPLAPEHETRVTTDTPEWITLAEAAFLAGVDETKIRSWTEAGLLESVSIFRNDPTLTLVSARDLEWAREREDQQEAVGSSPSIAAPLVDRRSRSRTRRYVEVGLTIALLLVWLNAIRPTFAAEPISGDRAGAPTPTPSDGSRRVMRRSCSRTRRAPCSPPSPCGCRSVRGVRGP
jgi:hypothetical protein